MYILIAFLKSNTENLIHYRIKISSFLKIPTNESWENDLYKHLKDGRQKTKQYKNPKM